MRTGTAQGGSGGSVGAQLAALDPGPSQLGPYAGKPGGASGCC